MPEERQIYEPQSDAAKIAMKGGTLCALAGLGIIGLDVFLLTVEAARDLPV